MAFTKALSVVMLTLADGLRKRQSSRRQCGVGGLAQGPNASLASMINGDDAQECTWTWHVNVRYCSNDGPWCGGVLLSPEWVLTKAECTDIGGTMCVDAGDWRNGNGQTRRSTQLQQVQHPDFSKGDRYAPALLRLEQEVEMNKCIGTVCLPEGGDVAPGSQCWITGWGVVKDGWGEANRPRAEILQQGLVSVLSNEDCQKTGHKTTDVNENMLCAQGRSSSGEIIDGCAYDKGGPIVCESSGIWTVYGVSGGSHVPRKCAQAEYPGLYYRVHAALDWIHETMDSQCSWCCQPQGCDPIFAPTN